MPACAKHSTLVQEAVHSIRGIDMLGTHFKDRTSHSVCAYARAQHA